MGKPDVMRLARQYSELSGKCRDFTADYKDMAQSEVVTLKYCGAMTDMIIETLQNLHEKMHPIFDLGLANGILREWGIKELTEADTEDIE